MELNAYKEEILLKLGGGVIKLELEDDGIIERIIMSAFREIQRYINTTKLITIPFQPVIDLTKFKVSSINQVYRVNETGLNVKQDGQSLDPFWLSITSTNQFGLNNDLVSNFSSYMRRRQISNTLSTDLSYYWDVSTKKLYINAPRNVPKRITIDYVPRYTDISEIDDPYWEDLILRLALALAKETLGRIRGKYTISNALHVLDWETILAEGREELSQLREYLQANSDIIYPLD